jgi:glycolate oxidase iron-sulfur subunit
MTVIDDVAALASDCVHCGFCLPTCPTYAIWHEEMDSPRGRIQLIETHVRGDAPLPASVVEHIDRCLGCMACLTSCPSGVRYDRLVEIARDEIERSHPRRGWDDRVLRWALFRVLPHPGRMRHALRLGGLGRALPLPGRLDPLAELVPPWRSTDAPARVTRADGESRGRVGVLTGCVQSVVFGDVNVATARVLAADGFDVIAPRQGCCGALSAHAGRLDEARAFARRLVDVFEAADVELVVVNAAGCGSHLKELGQLLGDDRARRFAASVRDAGELLADVRPRAPRHPLPLRVALHDPCHLRHAQRRPLAYESALGRVPGIELVEPDEQDICCGSAGIYNVVQAEAATELGDRKAVHVVATGPQVFASANPGCLVQMSQALRRTGSPLPTLHPIELVDASIRGVGAGRLRAAARR